MMLEQLTSADFLPYLNQPFVVYLENLVPYALELVSVTESEDPYTPGGRKPFSLIFSNPRKDAYLTQKIYPLEHEKMGSVELFIVPLGPDQTGMRYEAIFS